MQIMRRLFTLMCLLAIGLGGAVNAQDEQERRDEITLIAHFEQPGEYTLGVKFSGTPGEKFLIQWWDGRETITVENTNEIEWSHDITQETSEDIQYDVTIYSITPTGHILSLSIDSVYKYTDLYLKSAPELTALQVSHNDLKVLVLSGCHDLTYLDCSYNRLTTIDYMDKADSLIYLDISHNLLDNTLFSPLATQHYQVLKHLICNNTLVDGIVLDNLPALETFECSHNSQLTGLSLISMPALETVKFTDNPLCLSSSINDCPSLDSLDFTNNVQLRQLFVMNNAKLKSLDLSVAPNLENVSCSGNDSLATLSIDNPKLEYLSLHDLPALQYLSCRNTLLSALHFTASDSLPSLRTLQCSGNRSLKQLYLAYNYGLKTVECSDNPLLESLELIDCPSLDALDFSDNIQLKELYINHTKLKALDLSVTPNLDMVYCNGNDSLTLLEVNNPVLRILVCDHNRLESLLIDNGSALEDLVCSHNRLTSLALPSDLILASLSCDSNSLTLSNIADLVKQVISLGISPQIVPVLCQVGQMLDLRREMNINGETTQWNVLDADGNIITDNTWGRYLSGRFSFNQTGYYRIALVNHALPNHYEALISAEVFYDVTVVDSVARPVFSEPSGAVKRHTPVSLSTTTPDTRIYYTTDGSEPDSAALLYMDPISIDEAVTIKAIAIQDTFASRVATASYTIDLTANESDGGAERVRIYSQNRNIYLSEPLGEVEVFTAGGQCVYRGAATAISVKRSGLYVVVAKGGRWKVAVR